jgi:hypothetical protein
MNPMPRRFIVVLLLLGLPVLGAVASGCGGESDAHYTASTTVDCLKERWGVRDLNTSREDAQLVASSAVTGAFRVEFKSENSAIVLFERSPEDAEQHALNYEIVSRQLGAAEHSPRTKANVFSLWKRPPRSDDVNLLEECLSEGGTAVPLYEQDPSLAESFKYPEHDYDSYLKSCLRGEFTRSTCTCLLDWAQARYPAQEFRSVLSQKSIGRAVIKSCQ